MCRPSRSPWGPRKQTTDPSATWVETAPDDQPNFSIEMFLAFQHLGGDLQIDAREQLGCRINGQQNARRALAEIDQERRVAGLGAVGFRTAWPSELQRAADLRNRGRGICARSTD